jgi:CDP-glycerol glycerophosphotransferase (TagB/SpsB family)
MSFSALRAGARRELLRKAKTLRAWLWTRISRGEAARIRAQRYWLLGASSGAAYADNAAALHQYLRHHHPEINVLWVIDRGSPDVERARAVGPILFRDDWRTYAHALLADVVAISHGIHDVPGGGSVLSRSFLVRLGHGITALKKTKARALHTDESANRVFDLVPVSSEFEAKNKRAWGIPDDRIVVTGVPRFDTLLAKQARTPADPRRILYMPTWRDSAARSARAFRESEYVQGILEFLGSARLRQVLDEYNATVDVVFHRLVLPYAVELFEELANPRVVPQTLSDPQDLFAPAGLLITDYSSVAWDFLYVDKPVVFYQFDRESFDSERGSYLDDDTSLPGPLCRSGGELVREVERYLNGEMAADPTLAQVRHQWDEQVFAYRDDRNCERVYRAIVERLNGRGDAGRAFSGRGAPDRAFSSKVGSS